MGAWQVRAIRSHGRSSTWARYPTGPPPETTAALGRVDLRAFTGTYGDYLLGKVSQVFPQLRRDVLE
jgi:hypothetical protein